MDNGVSKITLIFIGVVLFAGIAGCQNVANTPKTAPSSASLSATFYCNSSFTGTNPSLLQLNPAIKISLYVGTNPKHYRLAIHDPAGSNTVAILNGTTTVAIPNVPASVDVEAAKIEIQNNGGAASNTCYDYIPQ
jgi:hypothetical protein